MEELFNRIYFDLAVLQFIYIFIVFLAGVFVGGNWKK